MLHYLEIYVSKCFILLLKNLIILLERFIRFLDLKIYYLKDFSQRPNKFKNTHLKIIRKQMHV